MRFKIYEQAINTLTGKVCVIVGTKEEPYQSNNDYTKSKQIKPDNGFDYLIMTKTGEDKDKVNYSGLISVMDNQLNKID